MFVYTKILISKVTKKAFFLGNELVIPEADKEEVLAFTKLSQFGDYFERYLDSEGRFLMVPRSQFNLFLEMEYQRKEILDKHDKKLREEAEKFTPRYYGPIYN